MPTAMIKVVVMALLLGSMACAGQALTTDEIAGAWGVAVGPTNQVGESGAPVWRSLVLVSNSIAWVWLRGGAKESHGGTFRIVPSRSGASGPRKRFQIEISSGTLDPPGFVVLQDVRYGLDSRFKYGTVVLKFRDASGAESVFLKEGN